MNIDLNNFNGAVVYENGKIIAYTEYTESEKQQRIDKAKKIVDRYAKLNKPTNGSFHVVSGQDLLELQKILGGSNGKSSKNVK